MDCSLPGSCLHGVSQARILEWIAISFSRGSSRPRDWTPLSWIVRWILYCWATREAPAQGSIQWILANEWMNLHHASESIEHIHKHLLHRVWWHLFELSRQWNSLERLSDLPYSQVVSGFRISFKIFWLLDRCSFQDTMLRIWSEPAFSPQTHQWPQQCFMAKQSITEHWTAKPCQHSSRTHHVYKGKSLSPMLKDRYSDSKHFS